MCSLQDGAYRRLQQTETTLAVDLDPQCPYMDYLVCSTIDFVASASCDLSSFPDGEDGCCVLLSGSSEVTLPSGLVYITAVFMDPAAVPVGKTRSQARIASLGDLELYMYDMVSNLSSAVSARYTLEQHASTVGPGRAAAAMMAH